MRVKKKTIGITEVTPNCYTTRPTPFDDKLTLLFELRQARYIRSHFQMLTHL